MLHLHNLAAVTASHSQTTEHIQRQTQCHSGNYFHLLLDKIKNADAQDLIIQFSLFSGLHKLPLLVRLIRFQV